MVSRKKTFRRRRQGKTDYRRRLKLIKSEMPRASVRITNTKIKVQIIEFSMKGDLILASATSKQLNGYGWSESSKSIPASYLAGYLAGKRSVKNGVKKAVLDVGRADTTPGGRIFASLKGLVDGGMEIPHSESVYPVEERIKGSHISEKIGKKIDKIVKEIDEGVK